MSVPNFMEIVQAVKKLNSISRERLNFCRRPILCTTLYRNPTQASNFGGTFDQLFLRFFYTIFTEDASRPLLYHDAKKSKMTKNSNQGGGGGPALKLTLKAEQKNSLRLSGTRVRTATTGLTVGKDKVSRTKKKMRLSVSKTTGA